MTILRTTKKTSSTKALSPSSSATIMIVVVLLTITILNSIATPTLILAFTPQQKQVKICDNGLSALTNMGEIEANIERRVREERNIARRVREERERNKQRKKNEKENNSNREEKTDINKNRFDNFDWKELFSPPPPPEDQFIMTGDISVLFMYAFTSHSLNDYIVKNVLSRQDISLVEAVKELDPTGSVINTQVLSVWVDPSLGSVAGGVNHALDVSAQEKLLNHWGPLLSTEGSSCVALCSCWLLAGYLHRAFLYRNTLECNANHALIKTIETWITTALLLTTIAIGTDFIIANHYNPIGILDGGLGYGSIVPYDPTTQTISSIATDTVSTVTAAAATSIATIDGVGVSAAASAAVVHNNFSILSSLTQSDVMFIVDSLTILIAWRWTANKMINSFL